jgi:hypothetical protein
MSIRSSSSMWRRAALITASAAGLLALPAVARAQYSAPDTNSGAVGEKYHVEIAANFWNPTVFGKISSTQFDIIGSDVDVVRDLGYQQTRFRDLRIVLRPSKKSRFKIQYTPIRYESQTTLTRTIVFNGINFNVSAPIKSEFDWKVLRLGYEYDFYYAPRGFIGALVEARYTQFDATLSTNSPLLATQQVEFTEAKMPLPAVGIVGRAYPLKELAINFEMSMFRLPNLDPKYEANYFDWDINGTVNVTNNVGLQIGWRKMTNYLRVEKDIGDLAFKGIWFGAAVRF